LRPPSETPADMFDRHAAFPDALRILAVMPWRRVAGFRGVRAAVLFRAAALGQLAGSGTGYDGLLHSRHFQYRGSAFVLGRRLPDAAKCRPGELSAGTAIELPMTGDIRRGLLPTKKKAHICARPLPLRHRPLYPPCRVETGADGLSPDSGHPELSRRLSSAR